MNSTYIWRKMNGNAFLTNDEREPVNRNRASADTGQRSAGKEEDSRLPEDRRRKMAFQSVDEIDTFSFDDCTVNRLEIRENRISMDTREQRTYACMGQSWSPRSGKGLRCTTRTTFW